MKGTVTKIATTNDTGTIKADDGNAYFFYPGSAGAALTVGDTVTFTCTPQVGLPNRAVGIRKVTA